MFLWWGFAPPQKHPPKNSLLTEHDAQVHLGFETEDDWFDYRLEHDLRFLQRVAEARQNLRLERGVKLEDLGG